MIIEKITVTREMVDNNPFFKLTYSQIILAEHELLLKKIAKNILGKKYPSEYNNRRFSFLSNALTGQKYLEFDSVNIGTVDIDINELAITFKPNEL